MASTLTGLKLQGCVGHFGKTAATDIEGYVELPDGKVVSGTDWGNLLLWDGNALKVEICRKDGRSCHVGTVQPFVLEDGQLMTFGSDGAVRGWDFESMDAADSDGVASRFEMEPVSEVAVGHNVCLWSVAKSPRPDSFLWFAQDSNGSIWKLDLSFTHMTTDPECLFSFHAGAIQGLDVSQNSHLMATAALDRSVRVFDFMSKREVTASRFNQGGTALRWAPPSVHHGGGSVAVGFEDGVLRLLELTRPRRVAGSGTKEEEAKLRLKQAFKPHNAPVTALAYERNGDVFATGSSDCTVFFFSVAEKYSPIGFIQVPGPVQGLEWSPPSHSENTLLVLCQNGHAVEVQRPELQNRTSAKSFQLSELQSRSFRFRSIKSRIEREEEMARRQAVKEKKKKEREALIKEDEEIDEEEEEEEEELPPIFIPDPPSPLYCGFYSQPGQFWLSMGGFDAGFLYHCKFSEKQEVDADPRRDEPFDFLPVHHSENDPILSVTFSSSRRLLLCGMHSGSIRVYPLHAEDISPASLRAHWVLSVHDNQRGQLRHIRCSHDDQFVLTAGDDGNIFSFGLLPPEQPQRERPAVPSPRVGLENTTLLAQDIEDSAAYSIETAKQKLEAEHLQREAELKTAARRKKLAELQRKFKQVLHDNQRLPEHVRLTPAELQLCVCFSEQAESVKSQRIMEVKKLMGWEEERSSIALSKLQDWFSPDTSVVTVVAVRSDHRVTSYRLPALAAPSARQQHQSLPDGGRDAAPERRMSRFEPVQEGGQTGEEEVLRPRVARPSGVQLGLRQMERLRKAAEKAEQARAKITKRKQEWAQLYAEKPGEDHEDPRDVQAIREARGNVGDLKLKTDKDFTLPRHLWMNTERKRAELIHLEENLRDKQTEMNGRIMALRESKVLLVARVHAQAERLHEVQRRLSPHLRRPPPVLPSIRPEETPEKRLQYDRGTLQRYAALRKQSFEAAYQEEDESTRLLEKLEKEMQESEDQDGGGEEPPPSVTIEEEEQEEEWSELEEELRQEDEIRLLYEQDSLLEQTESRVREFDAALQLLRSHKLRLDWQLKMGDLRQLTLYQELLLLKEFERKEAGLQEKLSGLLREENGITSKRVECGEHLEVKQRDVAKLQDRERREQEAFQTSLGENNKFEDFLSRVFKKKVKRMKKRKKKEEEEEQRGEERGVSDEDSDTEDWDEDEDDDEDDDEESETEDDSVCPPGCDPQLFENTLRLRERRLDLEELLLQEKKNAEALREESDALLKKEKVVRSSRMVAEDELETLNREKQEKMNRLDVVVPLRLHQVEFVVAGAVPPDLSAALAVERTELIRLHLRIKQLQVEKSQQRELKVQARQLHARLLHDRKDMKAQIHELENQCHQLMMMKFGRSVDLEALQMLSGNRTLEELKQEKLLREDSYAKEIREWDVKVEEARQTLMEATRSNTEILLRKTYLLDERKQLEHKLDTRQKKIGRQFQDVRRRVDQEEIRRLQVLLKKQSHQAQALRREIDFLSRKGGHVLPPGQTPLPPIAPVTTPKHLSSKHGAAF